MTRFASTCIHVQRGREQLGFALELVSTAPPFPAAPTLRRRVVADARLVGTHARCTAGEKTVAALTAEFIDELTDHLMDVSLTTRAFVGSQRGRRDGAGMAAMEMVVSGDSHFLCAS